MSRIAMVGGGADDAARSGAFLEDAALRGPAGGQSVIG